MNKGANTAIPAHIKGAIFSSYDVSVTYVKKNSNFSNKVHTKE